MATQTLTLSELKSLAMNGEVSEVVAHVQVNLIATKTTKDGKPYFEIHFVDARDRAMLARLVRRAGLSALPVAAERALRGNHRRFLPSRHLRSGCAALDFSRR